MAGRLLVARGETVTGLSPAAILTRALHTTSDFPLILAEAANRTLRAGIAGAPSGLKLAARRSAAKDFRTKTSVLAGEYPTLAPLNEHGEIKSGTLAEMAGKRPPENLCPPHRDHPSGPDDLGAFGDLARARPGKPPWSPKPPNW